MDPTWTAYSLADDLRALGPIASTRGFQLTQYTRWTVAVRLRCGRAFESYALGGRASMG